MADWFVAGATLALFAVTLVYVVLTWRLARSAESAATAAERSAIAAEHIATLESRPHVVVDSGGTADRDSKSYRAFITFHNYGRAPALDLTWEIRTPTRPLTAANREAEALGPGHDLDTQTRFHDAEAYDILVGDTTSSVVEWVVWYQDLFGNEFLSVYRLTRQGGYGHSQRGTYQRHDDGEVSTIGGYLDPPPSFIRTPAPPPH